MNDMEKMMNVMEAFRSSENCHKLLRYVDEIEEYIDDVIEEGAYEDELQTVRDLILRTNEFNWHHYFKEPSRQLSYAPNGMAVSKCMSSDSCPI